MSKYLCPFCNGELTPEFKLRLDRQSESKVEYPGISCPYCEIDIGYVVEKQEESS